MRSESSWARLRLKDYVKTHTLNYSTVLHWSREAAEAVPFAC